MTIHFHKKEVLRYITINLTSILGIVLVWRCIWYVLDAVDGALFGCSHAATAIAGIMLGLLVLYLPEKDINALEKL
jgi:hypothetical protein